MSVRLSQRFEHRLGTEAAHRRRLASLSFPTLRNVCNMTAVRQRHEGVRGRFEVKLVVTLGGGAIIVQLDISSSIIYLCDAGTTTRIRE